MDSRRLWLRAEADAVREEAEEERKWAMMMDQKPGMWETELKEKGVSPPTTHSLWLRETDEDRNRPLSLCVSPDPAVPLCPPIGV